jgi:GNAT superfamily N-acetyltransferase
MSDPVIAPQIAVDTDPSRLDLGFVHGFLSRSHWAKDIPFATMQRAIDHSIAFGLYKDGRQIGFARVVTDHATFAYMADVFVIEAERGKGYGKRLLAAVLAHPGLQGLRRWLLGTRDAADFYRQAGFDEAPDGFSFLERRNDAVYAPGVRAA